MTTIPLPQSQTWPGKLWLCGKADYLGEGAPPGEDITMGLSLQMNTIGTLGVISQFKYLKFHAHWVIQFLTERSVQVIL